MWPTRYYIFVKGYCQLKNDGTHGCTCFKGWTGSTCRTFECNDDTKICEDDSIFYNNKVKCIATYKLRECQCPKGLSGYDCNKRVCSEKETQSCGPNGFIINYF